MKYNELVNEILRLDPNEFTGGKELLKYNVPGKNLRKLPGSTLLYSVSPGEYSGTEISLWDPSNPPIVGQIGKNKMPGTIIGQLAVFKSKLPFPRAYYVNTINVSEDYRGMGMASALYGIALSQLGMTLIAGSSQTPGGRRAWVNLWNMARELPLELRGYLAMSDKDLNPSIVPASRLSPIQQYLADRLRKERNENIDLLMGSLGAEYIGKKKNKHYFAFDIQPDVSGSELESQIKTKYTDIYGDDMDDFEKDDIGIYARWHGAQGQ